MFAGRGELKSAPEPSACKRATSSGFPLLRLHDLLNSRGSLSLDFRGISAVNFSFGALRCLPAAKAGSKYSRGNKGDPLTNPHRYQTRPPAESANGLLVSCRSFASNTRNGKISPRVCPPHKCISRVKKEATKGLALTTAIPIYHG